ncbi:conserved hypothetical protein [Echinococcus multilocularis]|uniref:Uncharacterized protein n=1 Tax=Echinococcus multilocularis TaxID=6211 RepID=A0A068XWJ3_ECHMU|nr:conserved hypothetical protein [Echinococcus multilocularis]
MAANLNLRSLLCTAVMDRYQAPDRLSRMEFRRGNFDHGVRRSLSLDAQGRGVIGHLYDNHSLGGESFSDSDDCDGNDQRCLSPLPCREGCNDLLTKLMSPMINSIAVDLSVSLSRDEALLLTEPRSVEPWNESIAAKQVAPVDYKQAAYAARKSVRELYGKPSWWGDDDLEDERLGGKREKPPSHPLSAQPSRKMSFTDLRPDSPTGQVPDHKPAEAFTIDLNGEMKVTPRRQAEAFTIDLADGGNSSAAGSVCVPERLRRALQERQQLTRKHSVPTAQQLTEPATKAPPRQTTDQSLVSRQPLKGNQVGVLRTTSHPKTKPSNNNRPPITSPAVSSPKNVAKRTTAATAHKTTKTLGMQKAPPRKESTKLSPRSPPNLLTQRNRIPLRQVPSKTTSTPNGARKPATSRGELSRPSQSPSASPPVVKASERIPLPGTPLGATVQSSRVPLKRGLTPISTENGVKRLVGSPLQHRITASVKASGRQTTPTRTTVSEEKRISSATPNAPRLIKAPAASGSRGTVLTPRPKSSRPLFNSIKKPITTTNTATTGSSTICLPTKPVLGGSTVCDPVIQEIWSYKDAKEYVMEKMFQGISATYTAVAAAKCTTQAVFEEFKAAAAAAAASPSAPAAPFVPTAKTKPAIVCTPEERKELELFEKVEAEVNKFGEDEEEALAQALSPLVEDFSKTWIRGKNVNKSADFSHPPIDKLPVVGASTEENLATQSLSNAASTVTLENPMTHPEDHAIDPNTLQTAVSVQSIAETYVLDANDTLAAEGIPPVVIYDSVEKLLNEARGETSIMETSNTCTIPYQGTMTSRSGSPKADEAEAEEEEGEAEALQRFEEEINEGFRAEMDSLSSDDEREGLAFNNAEQAKSNSSGGRAPPGGSRRQGPPAIPEYLAKTPCWLEKREGSKGTLDQLHVEKSRAFPHKSDGAKKAGGQVITQNQISPTGVRPYQSIDSGVVDTEPHSAVFPLTNTASTTTNSAAATPVATFRVLPSNPPNLQGRIFPVEDSCGFLNASASPSTSSSSSSSSSPLIDHLKEEFLQPEIVPKSNLIRAPIQPSAGLEMQGPTSSQRAQSTTTRRSWNPENNLLEVTWSQLRRHASRCSIQSEYGENGRAQGSGYHRRHRYPSVQYSIREKKRTSDAVYPFAGQQVPIIRSTRSTTSLDTALLLRDSQEALNEIARRIYRQPTHPTVPATPIQLPQLQSLSTYLTHRYGETSVERSPVNEKFCSPSPPPPPLPPTQTTIGDLYSQSMDRSSMPGKSANHYEVIHPTRYFFASNQNQGPSETRQSISTAPYSPPISAPPISPVSIASATEPGHPFRGGRRPTNSNRYTVRRHSLRNANHQRVDSPTPNDLFPTEHSNSTLTHAPPSHLATKVVTEVKVMSSRPTGISVTSTVPPMVLQRRPEAESKHCSVVAITPILRGNRPSGTPADATMTGNSSSVKASSTKESSSGSVGGIAKPVARRFDADEVLRGSAFSAVAATRVTLRPTELRSTDVAERCRRSLSLGPVGACDEVGGNGDEIQPPPDPTDKSYESLLAASILRLSNRLRRCSDNLAQRIGAPSSDVISPVAPSSRKSGLKTSTSLHQELNDSLSNMRTVEQHLQYMESVLFGGGASGGTCGQSKTSTETDYLQELERINNELRGFVPIGASGRGGERDAGTAISLVFTEATDSGVDASMGIERDGDGKDVTPTDTPNGRATRSSEQSTFPNEDFY